MKKQEKISLVQYLYNKEVRMEQAVSDCSLRYIRRELDSIDLLEEIIAKERLAEFREISADIIRILALDSDE